MDILIELMIDLLFDAGLEVTKNKKINKWIRFPLILLILLFLIVVVVGLIYFGLRLIQSKDDRAIAFGVLLILFVFIIFIVFIQNILEEFLSGYFNNKRDK